MSLDEWERRVLDSDGASERVAKMIAELRAATGLEVAESAATMPSGGIAKPGIAIA